MMEELKKLMMKKAKEGKMLKPDSDEAKAKGSVLDELEDIADQGMAKKLQKVTVASPSQEGLEEGLEMAQEKVEGMDEDEGMMDEASMEEPMEDELDMDSLSPEQLEEMIQELEAKKMQAEME